MKKEHRIPLLLIGIAGVTLGFSLLHYIRAMDNNIASLTPWQCVGGCGAGGSGGSGADVKWIGTGVSGGLIDAEVMSSATLGENFEYKQLKTRLSWKPTWTTNLGLTIPIVSKIGTLQPQTNNQDYTEMTAGLGDMMVDISKSVGMEGEYSVSFNLTLPTGQYDVKRGRGGAMLYLPTSLQRGGGIFNASLGISRTKDVDKGLWVVEAFYNFPFAVNFHGKNQLINDQNDQFNDLNSRWDLLSSDQKKRFEYWFKPYGENDLGAYTPPSFTAAIYYGYRGMEHYVHSFGIKAWVPFGVSWIPDFTASSYNPSPDPDNKTWSITLHYGLEFSRPEFPIYLAVDKVFMSGSNASNMSGPFDESALRVWRAPDLKDVLNMWTFAIGIKATMF
jgi:hypothetical protein